MGSVQASLLQLLLDALALNSAEGDGVLNAERSSRAGSDCPQELVRVEVAAQAVEVGPVCPERADPGGQGVGDVDCVGRFEGAHEVHVGGTGPRRQILVEQLGEDPTVACVPGGIQHSQSDGAVVGLVENRRLRLMPTVSSGDAVSRTSGRNRRT
jgi:hypothetical protein